MERLISLFRRLNDEETSHEQSAPAEKQPDQEPEYFRQLMEYLREQKEESKN